MDIWLDWKVLNRILKEKENVYFFGRSEDWVPKTLNKLKKDKFTLTILDNNPFYNNTCFLSLDVKNPKVLEKFNLEKDFVIITAEPETIIPELEKYNLLPGKNFCCTPGIKEWGKLLLKQESLQEI